MIIVLMEIEVLDVVRVGSVCRRELPVRRSRKAPLSGIGARNRRESEGHPKGRSEAEEARSALTFRRTEVTSSGYSATGQGAIEPFTGREITVAFPRAIVELVRNASAL